MCVCVCGGVCVCVCVCHCDVRVCCACGARILAACEETGVGISHQQGVLLAPDAMPPLLDEQQPPAPQCLREQLFRSSQQNIGPRFEAPTHTLNRTQPPHRDETPHSRHPLQPWAAGEHQLSSAHALPWPRKLAHCSYVLRLCIAIVFGVRCV